MFLVPEEIKYQYEPYGIAVQRLQVSDGKDGSFHTGARGRRFQKAF